MSEPPWFSQIQSIGRVRPGTDGVLMQTLGDWSQPFEVVTKACVETAAGPILNTFPQAVELYHKYTLLSGAESQELVWEGVNFATTFQHRFFVKHVGPLGGSVKTGIRKIIRGVGYDYGLAANIQYFAECHARWQLQPVRMESEVVELEPAP